MSSPLVDVHWHLCAGSARQAFLTKADIPGTSDVEAALDQKAEMYIALLLGLINALPKTPKSSKDASRDANDPASLIHLEGAPMVSNCQTIGSVWEDSSQKRSDAGAMTGSVHAWQAMWQKVL